MEGEEEKKTVDQAQLGLPVSRRTELCRLLDWAECNSAVTDVANDPEKEMTRVVDVQ